MGKLVLIKKTISAEAIQVNSPEEDARVREWLSEMFLVGIEGISQEEAVELAQAQELSPVIDAKAWFARDIGSQVVYIIPPEDFIVQFEEVSEEDIEPKPYSSPFIISE